MPQAPTFNLCCGGVCDPKNQPRTNFMSVGSVAIFNKTVHVNAQGGTAERELQLS